ncbi:MAG: MerR family transcriptional regulator, partial [Rickettsiales bacterium]|nr:MerR family transcriptional regulator [Rickettsiales bacterium]
MEQTGVKKKSEAAFRTIGEVAAELELPQHVLRFWETKFSRIRPHKRRGGHRYYRPADVELLKE